MMMMMVMMMMLMMMMVMMIMMLMKMIVMIMMMMIMMMMVMGFYVLTVAHLCSCPFNIGSWGSPSGFHLQPPSVWVKPQGCHQEHLDTSVFFPMNA